MEKAEPHGFARFEFGTHVRKRGLPSASIEVVFAELWIERLKKIAVLEVVLGKLRAFSELGQPNLKPLGHEMGQRAVPPVSKHKPILD